MKSNFTLNQPKAAEALAKKIQDYNDGQRAIFYDYLAAYGTVGNPNKHITPQPR